MTDSPSSRVCECHCCSCIAFSRISRTPTRNTGNPVSTLYLCWALLEASIDEYSGCYHAVRMVGRTYHCGVWKSISSASATDVYGSPLQVWHTNRRSRADIHGKHSGEVSRFHSVEFVLGFDDTALCSSVQCLSTILNQQMLVLMISKHSNTRLAVSG